MLSYVRPGMYVETDKIRAILVEEMEPVDSETKNVWVVRIVYDEWNIATETFETKPEAIALSRRIFKLVNKELCCQEENQCHQPKTE